MRKFLLPSLLLLAVIISCKSAVIKPLVESNSYNVPVTIAKVEPLTNPSITSDPIIVSSIEEVIIVPASTTPTIVQISKKKKAFKQKVKEAFTNAPTHEIKSDKQNVEAYQPKKSLWWRWAILILFILMVIFAIVVKVANISPLGLIAKIFKK